MNTQRGFGSLLMLIIIAGAIAWLYFYYPPFHDAVQKNMPAVSSSTPIDMAKGVQDIAAKHEAQIQAEMNLK